MNLGSFVTWVRLQNAVKRKRIIMSINEQIKYSKISQMKES